jgi:hypothetical protein
MTNIIREGQVWHRYCETNYKSHIIRSLKALKESNPFGVTIERRISGLFYEGPKSEKHLEKGGFINVKNDRCD